MGFLFRKIWPKPYFSIVIGIFFCIFSLSSIKVERICTFQIWFYKDLFTTVAVECNFQLSTSIFHPFFKKVGRLNWKRSFHTSLHFMKWDEENCLRKFWSIEKTFLCLFEEQVVLQLFPKEFAQSIFQLLNLPKESRYSTSWRRENGKYLTKAVFVISIAY